MFTGSITEKGVFIHISLPPVAYELESASDEIKRIIDEEGLFCVADYPFTTLPNFLTSSSIIAISKQKPIIRFLPDDSVRLGFIQGTIRKKI